MHIGEPMMAALILKSEPLVVDSQRMQHRRMQIVDRHRAVDDVVREIVSFSIGDAWRKSATGQPHREAARMMIAPIVFRGQFSLAVNGPPELSPPDDESFIEQAPLGQILNE